MTYRTEPPFRHGQPPRTALLIVNLGTPDAPTPAALRRYLAEFLADPRVVEIARPLWWLILHGVVLRTRPARSARKYAVVWTAEGSPLAVWTARQAAALQTALAERGHELIVRHAMRYGSPAIPDVLADLRAQGATRLLVLPMYPQYAAATSASVADRVMAWAQRTRRVPELRFVGDFHDDAGYVSALAERLRDHWSAHGRAERLVLSFHGLPQRSLTLGDPYHCQCLKTARLLAAKLGLDADAWVVTFQSRFGRARWLEPYTEATLVALARAGVGRIDVMCPGFIADCLETLQEIADEARDAFIAAGGTELRYIDCLNTRPSWIAALADLSERHLEGWPTRAPASVEDLQAQRERALASGAVI